MKNLVIPIGLVAFLITGFMGYGKLTEKVATTEKTVEKVEEKVEATEEELNEKDILDMKQTILIESIAKTLDKLNSKIDKGDN